MTAVINATVGDVKTVQDAFDRAVEVGSDVYDNNVGAVKAFLVKGDNEMGLKYVRLMRKGVRVWEKALKDLEKVLVGLYRRASCPIAAQPNFNRLSSTTVLNMIGKEFGKLKAFVDDMEPDFDKQYLLDMLRFVARLEGMVGSFGEKLDLFISQMELVLKEE